MQQRQLRLGDILDDYCPRERRITNHAIVAIVGQEVRQTRCVTCEAEHEYKQARIPPQRKKKPAQGALYQEVLSGMPARVAPSPPAALALDEDDEPAEVPDDAQSVAPPDGDGVPPPPQAPEESEGPVHRPLIRATIAADRARPEAARGLERAAGAEAPRPEAVGRCMETGRVPRSPIGRAAVGGAARSARSNDSDAAGPPVCPRPPRHSQRLRDSRVHDPRTRTSR
jgi:hypothetical protein